MDSYEFWDFDRRRDIKILTSTYVNCSTQCGKVIEHCVFMFSTSMYVCDEQCLLASLVHDFADWENASNYKWMCSRIMSLIRFPLSTFLNEVYKVERLQNRLTLMLLYFEAYKVFKCVAFS
jgi:hypothetical protein